MSTAKSSSKFLKLVVLVLCLAGSEQALAGALPETENGRYALSPTGDGVLRLDTRTGAISTCNNSGVGWACYAVPDERAAMDTEIGRLQADVVRLQADNERLKAQLAEREPTVPGKQLVERSGSEEISAAYEQNRQDALAADVFGSPVYVLEGEVFWGQDRLELLEDALKSGRGPYSSKV